MSDAGLAIIAAECKSACANEPDFEQRCRKAMKAVADSHWMFPGPSHEDLRYRGAVGAVLMSPETTDEEKERIKYTLSMQRALSAAMSGVPVNMESVLREGIEPAPLVAWWHESKSEKAV